MKTAPIGVSACLLGFNCKYNGKNNLNLEVINFIKGKEVVPFCPEELGGLQTPRIPSEITQNGKVINQVGQDVTNNFTQGAFKALEILKTNNCESVILKDGSPSCGYTFIYDGTFSNVKIPGEGITCKYLKNNGIKIIDFIET
ncbi:MAG: DUF523 domain-containing protein [Candidatus Izemoplasmatales bacterium]|jgi:uncharacterized protein YbbK (DUF523 family)